MLNLTLELHYETINFFGWVGCAVGYQIHQTQLFGDQTWLRI